MLLYASVYMCLVVTCWERADLLTLVCGVLLLLFYFPIGILGQVWYLIVSIPDLCTLTFLRYYLQVSIFVNSSCGVMCICVVFECVFNHCIFILI